MVNAPGGHEIAVAQHFLQDHAVGERQLQVRLAAGVGIFVDPEENPLLVDLGEALAVHVPLDRLGADLVGGRADPLLQLDVARRAGALLGAVVPVLGHARESARGLVEQAVSPVELGPEARADVGDASG